MCRDDSKFLCARLAHRRAVEINFRVAPLQAAEFLQDADELHFIIRRIQSQAKFGNQVMTVNQIWHGIHFTPSNGQGISRV